MKFDVVVFGSAFVDVYLQSNDFKTIKSSKVVTGIALCEEYGGKIPIKKQVITTGGGGTNSAVSFERLGLQTGLVCCVGKDDWGLFIRKELKREGVSPIYIQQVDDDTSYSTMLVSKDGGRSSLVYRKASNQLSWRKVGWNKLTPDWFYVSSLGGDLVMLTRIVREAKRKNIKVAWNPGSKEIASSDKLKSFLPYIEVLLINRAEGAKLTRNDYKNKEMILNDLSKFGVNIIAMTDGKKGAVLIKDKKRIRMSAFNVKTVEETGAGDAFGSAFVAGLIKGYDLEKSLKLGLVNGASVTEYFGPKKGLLFEPEANNKIK